MKIELEEKYYSKREIKTLKIKYEKHYQQLKKKWWKLLWKREDRIFYKTYQNLENIIEKINQRNLQTLLEKHGSLFQNIGGYTLDQEQQIAILKEEDAHLLVAGAGSGKTLTMIGKIKYLVEVKKIPKEKILCISFTNATVEDFKKDVKKALGYEVEVLTFHKLGLKVLKQNRVSFQICKDTLMKDCIHQYFIKQKETSNFQKEFFKVCGEKEEEIEKLVLTFLNIVKGNFLEEINWEPLEEKAKKEKNRLIKRKNIFLLQHIKAIYQAYEQTLEKNMEIDFHDMIKQAVLLINEGYSCLEYAYMIVDEYQDTSYLRYALLKSIKDKNNCPLFAVGDDWQSIYRFAGCNVALFTKFHQYFENATYSFLSETYRNSQELIDVASHFIMKNPHQLKKQLKSAKHLKKPIQLYTYQQENEIPLLIAQIIQTHKSQKWMILGRNHQDIDELKRVFVPKKTKLSYRTIHQSKGLQSENVIVVNLKNQTLGFPSKITNDPLLHYLLEKEQFPYDEERRLFYVALTRTKNKVYLLVPKTNPSIFVNELRENYKKYIEESSS